MVNFNGIYIAADQIVSVEKFDTSDLQYPKGLRVSMKTGSSFGVRYKNEKDRDREQNRIVNDIYGEIRQQKNNSEWLITKVCMTENALGRIEKRQLKIQRVLRKILKSDELDD